jgi:hypothetical protein
MSKVRPVLFLKIAFSSEVDTGSREENALNIDLKPRLEPRL